MRFKSKKCSDCGKKITGQAWWIWKKDGKTEKTIVNTNEALEEVVKEYGEKYERVIKKGDIVCSTCNLQDLPIM